ncbi:DNA-3-methyladenine glycosylase isoform X2 [Xenopus laevis]|uniref:DNA-3-methyladenine glycosylase n=1 Tax=Xenopus laevis TaxID=8355 RepID=A0A8J1LUI8_XENLA|nr:DNA-3-methyladenine glycosylase isoform X2 [Xenopus laevis]
MELQLPEGLVSPGRAFTSMPRKRQRVQTLHNAPCKMVLLESTEQNEPPSSCSEEQNPKMSRYFQNLKVRLPSEFYNQPCIELAKSFLGQVLVHKLPDGTELRGRIVETESYLGGEDEASHSRGGKRTERNVAMYMKPGTIYVYQIYGDGAAVLLRSLEPLEGLDMMRNYRNGRRHEKAKPLKDSELCNGPSKLCQALDLNKNYNRRDLSDDQDTWMEAGSKILDQDIVSCARIGIGSAGEWAKKPLRFYIKGNKYVSVRDKVAEANS